ncbi:hypothetical protein SBDP2_1810002 [Syntrophobacter sp. SbD2]|nr:hypothetical protein SBDP2_1810002 [Syntrophobacter sp. SbD2]
MIQGFLHGHLRHVTANNLAEAQVTEQQKPDRQGGDQGILAKHLRSHQARQQGGEEETTDKVKPPLHKEAGKIIDRGLYFSDHLG